ncbi:phage head spike fiber domain-containing protein [Bradyrhizobium iriomotense]|uniref:Uncharacterized protein n=1 Tax=Bradyrhizobium iriomotense TaxID=441950 RepID=A0ABQ6B5X8_9BRAD|nr:hypothetical protein [Bradyrhizobium iriomotense]GLR89780.1 hypothetical protein GCM10007857_64940 [Bradyrhizobium iriomotense]
MNGQRLLRALALLVLLATWARVCCAQVPDDLIPQGNWYRNGSTLDLDFYNDRYWLNGTTYSGVANFISGAGATFTRSGTHNITSTSAPFYLDSSQGQAFVSRAPITTTYTATGAPFYLSGSQAFVSRASTGTYFDNTGTLQTASSNVARSNYIYNGSSWVLGGTLIEPAATNLATYSSDLSHWTANGTFTLNHATTAPDGSTAYSVSSSGSAGAYLGISCSASTAYSMSAFVKYVSGTARVRVWSDNTSFANGSTGLPAYVEVNSQTGAVLLTSSGVLSSSVVTMANGWFRVIVNAATDTSCTNHFNLINYNVASVATENAFWGDQVEAATFPTSYIPTSGSTAARSADVYTSPFDGTYFNSSGVMQTTTTSVARTNYTYNGSSWVNAGTLIEPAATNYLTYSTDLTHATPRSASISAITTTAPDGTTSTQKLMETSATDIHVLSQSYITLTAGSTYTFSAYVKSAERNIVELSFDYPAISGSNYCYRGINFNLGTGAALVATPVTNISCAALSQYGMQQISNGWWYLWVVDTVPAGATNAYTSFSVHYNYNTNKDDSYAGTTGSGLYIWGPQNEIGSTPTSYIPASGSSASRSADIYSVPNGGTYFNSSGVMKNAPSNTARLDHSPSSPYQPFGVLIEESRTNYVSTSGANSNWPYQDAVVSATTAPDSSYAQQFTLDTAAGGRLWMEPGPYSNNTFTGSAYVRGIAGSNVTTVTPHIKNCQTDTVVSTDSAVTLSTTAWTRVSSTGTTTGSGCGGGARFELTFNNGGSSSTVLVWGVQLEVGSFPTSYIPTVGSTVTRNPDAMTIGTTAAGASGVWYTAGQGTLLASGTIPYVDSTNAHRFAEIDDGSNNNIVTLTATNAVDKAAILNAGAVVYAQNPLSTVANSLIKGGIAYSSNVYSAFSGTAYTSGSGISIPAMTQLCVGCGVGGGAYFLDGWVNRVVYFQSVQPNASLPDYTR